MFYQLIFNHFRKMLWRMMNKVQTDEDNTTPTSGQEGDVEEDGVLTGSSTRIAIKEVPHFMWGP